MLNAGTLAAEHVLRTHDGRLSQGVEVHAGAGNNGGDAYVVAAQLARAGVRVELHVAAPPKTDDAIRAAALAAAAMRSPEFESAPSETGCAVVIDGLLGTGHRGPLRAFVCAHTSRIAEQRAKGAHVLALDIPTGVDSTTGVVVPSAVTADTTITFGTVKRGLVIARQMTGRIVLGDIGLGDFANADDHAWCMPTLADLGAGIPPIAWNAHKGTRGHLALVGGAAGMAGAIVLATRAALRSGVGLAKGYLGGSGAAVLQSAVPQAIANSWSDGHRTPPSGAWAHALAIGPGLGLTGESLAMLRDALDANPELPVVLDADALTLVAQSGGDVAARLHEWCGTRDVVITPHAGEFARLAGAPLPTDDWQARAQAASAFARRAKCTVLLKGAPTLVACADGTIAVSPRGNAVLSTGGSGDMLAGVIGTLLAQGVRGRTAAIIGAAVHGIAAELTGARIGVRGATLDDVLEDLPRAWRSVLDPAPLPPGILLELPSTSLR